jgi:hypothetical protein
MYLHKIPALVISDHIVLIMVNERKMLMISDKLNMISRVGAQLNVQHIEMVNYFVFPVYVKKNLAFKREIHRWRI